MMTMELEFTRPQVGQVLVQNGKHEDVDAKKMHGVISRTLISHVFTVGQKFAIEFCGNNYLVTVVGYRTMSCNSLKETTRWMNGHLLIIIIIIK